MTYQVRVEVPPSAPVDAVEAVEAAEGKDAVETDKAPGRFSGSQRFVLREQLEESRRVLGPEFI